jgi:hypothetical protein
MKNKGDLLASILTGFDHCYFFLHNTRERIIVERIMNEGFIFENQLLHSTDRVNPQEPIEVTYFLFQRKDYGPFTIIIAIPKRVFDSYTHVSNKYNIGIEEVLSVTDPFYGDNDELIYKISPKHILGYYNNKTEEFFKNKSWDPDFKTTSAKSFRRDHHKK